MRPAKLLVASLLFALLPAVSAEPLGPCAERPESGPWVDAMCQGEEWCQAMLEGDCMDACESIPSICRIQP